MNKVYLLLGGNIGDRLSNLERAKKKLQEQIGSIASASAIYETASWGNEEQPAFLNQVVIINTNLPAQQIMQQILSIESKSGRIRTEKNASRIIDIDILFFNKDIVQTANLVIPHPQIQNRNFVLYPMDELSPDLVHPVIKKTIHELRLQCRDTLAVKPYEI